MEPAEFWEQRYRTHRDERGQVWSGRVNPAVEREAADLTPGSALELGSGEGGDALWLAEQGWSVTALDISPTALAVGAAQAAARGVADRIAWMQADLVTWRPDTEYDLVASAFFHSPFDFPRKEILRRATRAVAPGGTLLIVGHGTPLPGLEHDHGRQHAESGPPLPDPDEVLADLELPADWVVERNAVVSREAALPDGTTIEVSDTVVRVRRPA
ncbi:class I SAM-dependent methyltransferase [uncultured Microbacterium sp.]|uniref:SAM-dependent methyltransferase n=1 Tax=uncultured Microbacterium sp. TaxID=191216 RepID=UPI0028DB8A0A|nr:class I SAM-dependent methyltransferase [uncultured Microbacterium sp.]